MDWQDEGIVLSVRPHGETSAVLELLTRAHGRQLGLVRGGRSRRLRPVLQPGNRVSARWRARLDGHLGHFTVEGLDMAAGRLLESRFALNGLGHLAAMVHLLPERDPHESLYDAACVVLEHIHDVSIAPALMVRFELALLAELGFGLDLGRCAATGAREDLAFVSPKTGRAVSREAAAPYADRLFPLPPFLIGSGPNARPTPDDVAAGFRLTGYFLERHVLAPRGQRFPDARAFFMSEIQTSARA